MDSLLASLELPRLTIGGFLDVSLCLSCFEYILWVWNSPSRFSSLCAADISAVSLCPCTNFFFSFRFHFHTHFFDAHIIRPLYSRHPCVELHFCCFSSPPQAWRDCPIFINTLWIYMINYVHVILGMWIWRGEILYKMTSIRAERSCSCFRYPSLSKWSDYLK